MEPTQKYSIEYINIRLSYNPETAQLYWRKREPHTVSGSQAIRMRICRNWNARFEGKEAFTCISKRGYYTGVIDNKRLYKHHVIWAMHYGEWPQSMIDHIDGNPLNNHISNLRLVTSAQNQKNMKLQERNKTGQIGVWYDKNRDSYQAFIAHNRKRISLGRFKSLDDAIAVRLAAEKKYGYHPNHGRTTT